MQVNMHGIERAETVDFRKEETTHPFIIARLFDGKSSAVDIYLSCRDDAVKLAEVAKNALGMWTEEEEGKTCTQ